MDHITHQQCPVCNHRELIPHLECEDHLVSHRKFAVVVCPECGMGMTQDVPAPEHIGSYYKSENYISHSDTKKGLVNTLYHQVRALMLKRKQKLVEQQTDGGRGTILDIGCGTGYFLGHMKKQGWRVHGTEPDADARAIASKLLGEEVWDSPGLFDLGPYTCDVITMWHVLEHVYELAEYLRQMHSILKSGGSLIVAVPNYTSYDAGVYQEKWAAYDVPRHLWHFSPRAIVRLIEPYGFEFETRKRMPFDSFYIAMVSEKYRNSGLGLVKGMMHGGMSFVRSLADIEQSSSLIYVFRKK